MDVLALGSALLVCAAITVASLATGTYWKPQEAAAHAPWCLPDQSPSFAFGFADLAHSLGDVMGQPLECEHGAPSQGDMQETTTGLAVYQWCTNTSTFTRGSEHWALLATGVVHWTDGEPPPEVPVVRTPDLREPCAPT